MKRLEGFVAEKAQDGFALFTAALAYARASQVLGAATAGPAEGRAARAGRYAEQAVALLDEATLCGLELDNSCLRAHPDLGPLRGHPGFTALLGRLHLDRRWYVNGQGQTLTVVRGPVEFDMGSPGCERDRQAYEEQHRVRVGRSFAVATRTVTAREFRRFRPEQLGNRQFSPEEDGPVNAVTWYQAAQYCRWLSEQEDIPESQMCFPPAGSGRA
jgi:hypothetical protein